jgi:hypothetical protein
MKLRICEAKDGIIVERGFKEFKSVDYSASKWIREEIAKTKTEDAPQTTNGLDMIEDAKTMCGLMIPYSLGYFNNGGNNPYHNTSMVGIYTTAYMNGHGLSITPENFSKVCALFTARKTIKSN